MNTLKILQTFSLSLSYLQSFSSYSLSPLSLSLSLWVSLPLFLSVLRIAIHVYYYQEIRLDY